MIELFKEDINVISVVGSGGKTSFIHILAREYIEAGWQVIITTTTHMAKESYQWCVDEEEIAKAFLQGSLVYVGEVVSSQKVGCIGIDKLERLICHYPKVKFLIEADGSKRLPFKVPQSHEPVLVESSQVVCLIVGIWALGEKFKTHCHRLEEALAICDRHPEDRIVLEDVLRMVDKGYLQGKMKDLYKIFLNGPLEQGLPYRLDKEVYSIDLKERSNGIYL